jgi:DNA recombination protein RmuC
MNFDVISLCAGLALGAAVGALFAGRRAARLEAEKAGLERAATELAAAEGKFALQFENLANRIFEEKTQSFKRDSHEGLAQILGPLRERLHEFQKKVDDSFGAQAKEHVSLKTEIESIVKMNQRMSEQAESLTRALKGDVKAQGNWGEVMLEKILEQSGLRKGEDYILQGADMGLKHAETGGALKPDVVVMLPEDKHVIIDAKVSLTAYERFCAADGAEEEKTRHLKDYLASVRAHVAGLEQRRYHDTDRLGTPDFVLMFLPVEGAYSLAVQQDASLHTYAWDRKIVIVCPATLFATLRTVASVWRIELQNRNAVEIARQGGNLYDKVAGFVEDMENLGKRIAAAGAAYDSAFRKLSSGTGSIVKRTEDLKALGLKTSKKLPASLADEQDDTPLKNAENG